MLQHVASNSATSSGVKNEARQGSKTRAARTMAEARAPFGQLNIFHAVIKLSFPLSAERCACLGLGAFATYRNETATFPN
ncbi:hypothetical protein ACLKA6_015207 [Drosophila palustris]